jgi:uncharacterized membrane protein HdeD (DUF308 family)
MWTLLFASFFSIAEFRFIAAISLKFPNRALFDGFLVWTSAFLLWAQWPWSGTWILGMPVGVSLILRGWTYVMFALAMHSSPQPIEIPSRSLDSS